MDGYGTDEQRAAYRDGLLVEKDGYEQKVAAAKALGDSAKADLYTNRIAQVDAEIANVDGADVESELSPAEKLAAAKTVAALDELAGEIGYEFDADVKTKADKQAALAEHLEA